MSALLLDPGLVLAEAARLREAALKDKTYRSTPIGALAGRYLDEIAFHGYADKTVVNREGILYHLSFDLAHLEPAEVTAADLKAFLAERWADASRNTKAAATSAVKVLFAWAHDNELIPSDPARRLRGPRAADTERVAHSHATIRKLVIAQDSQRDRVALLVLYWCALRRNELRLVQFRHVDLANRLLTVFGKGSRVLEQSIPPQLALELERHILDRQPHPNEYLLHPQKWGRRGSWPDYTWQLIWEDRRRPYSNEGIGAWWKRCVEKSGLDAFPMHEMRHTSGTHFYRQSHDLVATQHLLRHVNPATTARTYIHEDRIQAVAEVQRRMIDPLEEA